MSHVLAMICSVSVAWMVTIDVPSNHSKPVSVPPELTGTWAASGSTPAGPDGESGMSWEMELRLQGDKYVRSGYPDWDERATISRIVKEGRTYRLTLVDHVRNGDEIRGEVVTVVLGPDGRKLEHKGMSMSRSAR